MSYFLTFPSSRSSTQPPSPSPPPAGNSLAVLTPDQAITACEISSDGKAVVMALEGRNEIVTFLLCHQKGVDGHASPKSYGNDTNRGKVFDLSQAG